MTGQPCTAALFHCGSSVLSIKSISMGRTRNRKICLAYMQPCICITNEKHLCLISNSLFPRNILFVRISANEKNEIVSCFTVVLCLFFNSFRTRLYLMSATSMEIRQMDDGLNLLLFWWRAIFLFWCRACFVLMYGLVFCFEVHLVLFWCRACFVWCRACFVLMYDLVFCF